MYKAAFVALFTLVVCSASSQRIYFIYLQSESQQPFFVKLGDKLQSSSTGGYLVLSRLKDSTYTFAVGFTEKSQEEPVFTCTINKKDHGYMLKKFEKGWGLVDLQTSSIQMAVNEGKKDATVVTGQVNAFTDLLAKAADDSTLKQKNRLPEEKPAAVAQGSIKKGETKESSMAVTDKLSTVTSDKGINPDTSKNAVVPASTIIKEKEDSKESPTYKPEHKPAIPDTFKIGTADSGMNKADSIKAGSSPVVENKVTTGETFVRSKIARKSESSTTDGFGLTYIDTYPDGRQDTIQLVIPEEGKVQMTEAAVAEPVTGKKETDVSPTGLTQKAVNDGSLVKGDVSNSCRNVATDADFYKLRKKMAAGKSDGDMVAEAKRSFKTKCFTTRQVKNLGSLFLGDGGKYNFFEAASLHISDPGNFASLQSELKDEYFVNRFKALLH